MSHDPNPSGLAANGPTPEPARPWRAAFRHRVLAGLVFALPLAVTFWVVYQLYFFARGVLLDPSARAVRWLIDRSGRFPGLPDWWVQIVSPLVAVALALGTLYLLGYLGGSWVQRMLDWFLFRVPLVTTIYKAVRGVVSSALDPKAGPRYQRVVLIEFPHPGMRSLGFVTGSLRDPDTGRTILAVCLLTGVMPPQGFTLFVPEDQVFDVDWSVNETLQAILSGGMTTPPLIRYASGGPTHLIVPGQGAAVHPRGPGEHGAAAGGGQDGETGLPRP